MMTTIIGAEGSMGVWLREHLTRLGHTVKSFDDRKGDSPRVLHEADMVMVSVPVRAHGSTCYLTTKIS